ncbi:HAD-like domain-containing protein [Sphaerosporella brunnea]|uniref:HAD-like domain-containing protein n=1 Tax=Sphaerosporella brunnea TaxID=1250544 RepID=A0A5J5ERC4_9PEZI|nr:HAD-like domain-containing protein [Sphaerosporella brunnea]
MSTKAVDLNHKAIVFSDFDGTITLTDSNDFLTDNIGYGYKRRRELNIEILEGRWTFRDAFRDMLSSVGSKTPFEECKKLLIENIQLDPGFKPFFEWCQSNDVPIIVLSSGMKPLIRALLDHFLGAENAEKIQIVANDVKIHPDGTWEVVFCDESHFGHDKSRAIKPYREAREKLPKEKWPTFFYCGDGVSDLSAARETDLLFAKAGHDLITYCKREGVPYKVFHSFEDILRDVKDVVEGRKTTDEIAENR